MERRKGRGEKRENRRKMEDGSGKNRILKKRLWVED